MFYIHLGTDRSNVNISGGKKLGRKQKLVESSPSHRALGILPYLGWYLDTMIQVFLEFLLIKWNICDVWMDAIFCSQCNLSRLHNRYPVYHRPSLLTYHGHVRLWWHNHECMSVCSLHATLYYGCIEFHIALHGCFED